MAPRNKDMGCAGAHGWVRTTVNSLCCSGSSPKLNLSPVVFIWVQPQNQGQEQLETKPRDTSPVPSHLPGAKNPSRAAKSRNQGDPWVMEQVRQHLPLHRQKSSSIKWIRRVGEEVTANRTGIRYLVRQADMKLGKKEKKKGGGNKSFTINSGVPILLLTITIECWIPKSRYFFFIQRLELLLPKLKTIH